MCTSCVKENSMNEFRYIPKFLINPDLAALSPSEVLHDGEGVVRVMLPDAVVTIAANKEVV